MRRTPAIGLLVVAWVSSIAAAEPLTGRHAKVGVTAPTRMDWVFALANQSPAEPPADWTAGYESTRQTFELFVPKSYSPKKAWPLVLFLSPGDQGAGWPNFQQACEKLGVIFASPHGAGNGTPNPRRVRIVLDVLDEVRRTYRIDPDRTYIGGFSGGGRVACAIGFALPEHFGGVIPVCAAGELRSEPWLRHRAIERLSVAHITGETDFNRGEVERYRGPLLEGMGVRSRVWMLSRMGHSVPPGQPLVEVLSWLDEKAKERGALARDYPASRIGGDEAPSREEWSAALLAEGKERIKDRRTLYSGLMQLAGVRVRWNGLPAADEATAILTEFDSREDHPWEAEEIAEQRKFLIARARAVDAYATGPLPEQYAKQKGEMLEAALTLWKRVLEDGKDAKAVAEATKRVPALEALIDRAGR